MTPPAGPDAPVRLAEDSVLSQRDVRRVLALLNGDGEAAYVVGGAVRNALLGLPPGDIDIATTALPEAVTARAKAAGLRAIPTGIEHGTVTVVLGGRPFEVTTLRRDVETDGRRAVVRFSRDIADDASRRDFTMNALYATADGTVLDPVGGLPDLRARRVRFIGDADTRIREDYLRILRLFRFHAAFGEGPLDGQARDAAVRLRAGLARLSAERVKTELFKLLAARRALETVTLAAELGFVDRLLGGVGRTGVLARLVAGWPEADALTRFAALALFTADDVPRLQERLRLSRAEATRLAAIAAVLDAHHGRAESLDAAALRGLQFRRGADAARAAVAIAWAADSLDVAPHLHRLAPHLARPAPVSPFTGALLLERGVTPGPLMGEMIARAEREWVAAGCPEEAEVWEGILGRVMG